VCLFDSKIAFASQQVADGSFSVYTRALENGDPKLVADDGHPPKWSPSGKEIAFRRDLGGHDSIFVSRLKAACSGHSYRRKLGVFTFNPAELVAGLAVNRVFRA